MVEKTVAMAEAPSTPATTEGTRNRERYIAPPVDIYENNEGLVVLADLPGVTQDNLDVRVDNNMLTIQGHAAHVAPGEPVYREYQIINFFRQFELSDKVNQAKISAELKHGVLVLQLPKAEEAKARQIEVQVA